MLRRSVLWTLLFLVLIFSVENQSSWATRTRILNLNDIIKRADTIFEGECIGVKTGKDPENGMVSTWFTFRVLDGIKGNVSEEFVLKQFGGQEGERTVYMPTVSYQVGERVILFLYGKSEIGYSSAVGYHQGKFAVKEIPETGKRYVTNGMPARILFENTGDAVSTLDSKGARLQGEQKMMSEKLERDEFLSLVETKVKEEREAKQ